MKKYFIFLFLIIIFFSCKKDLPIDNTNVEVLTLNSKIMNKDINNTVIKPIENKKKDSLAVIYILHGAYGNYNDWISHVPELIDFSNTNDIIIVCPDGGYNSWYFDSPIDSNFMYETYIIKELIPSIDSIYSTSKSKYLRAITGNSMGGHGSFYLAIRNQNSFAYAGSMSGGLDIRPFSESWNISDRLGPISLYTNNWQENTVINMANLIDSTELKLIFDCGNNDFFLDVNNNFHQELLKLNIPHVYNTYSGSHDWSYWSEVVFYHLSFFKMQFDSVNYNYIESK